MSGKPQDQDGRLISLDRSRNARAFDLLRESFWRQEIGRIVGRVEEHLASLRSLDRNRTEDDRSNDEDQRPYLSIAIFGPSGSGKSSLLKTLVREINRGAPDELLKELRDRPGHDRKREKVKGKVYALPVMYPDRFARHDHFLYAFLANALKEEKEVRDQRRKGRQERYGRDSEPSALSPVQQSFQELSEFLRVIDEPEKGQDFDPLGLSLERLERHTSGLLLREKIAGFINHLADELSGSKDDSVVLLTVDDADMSPEHLVTILQTYQSYLLHSRLIPIFNFTDRTAEEILRVYFRKHIGSSGGRTADEETTVYEDPGEGTQKLEVGTQLALQYLSRCFPVRNRIRLGPAPTRLRSARYEVLARKKGEKGEEYSAAIDELLKNSSRLLFGCPDRDATHHVRTLLRPSTLRRQLHVVDEMVESGVEELYRTAKESSSGDDEESCESDDRLRWVTVFNRSAWALMNVHRDVLREYDLHLEDLYSWSPQGLQRVILDTLLAQDLESRRALLRRWRRRTDSRRGQTLSLLAANVFRPWLPGDEPSGDEGYVPRYTPAQLHGSRKTGDGIPEGKEGITAPTALIWFLRLVIGFYNPQLLAWSRPTDVARQKPEMGRVVGVGWDLSNGPINAMRAAASDEAVASSGMILLEPRTFAEALREESWLNRWGVLCGQLPGGDKATEIKILEERARAIRMAMEREDREPRGLEWIAREQTERFHRSLGYSRFDPNQLETVAEAALRLQAQRPGLSFPEVLELLELDRLAKHLADHGTLVEDKTPSGKKSSNGWTATERVRDLADDPDPHGNLFTRFAERLGGEDSDSSPQRRILSQNIFLLRCWSYYGYDRNRYWSAVSFWRGLGLVGRLLEARRREQLEAESEDLANQTLTPGKRAARWKDSVKGILRTHLIRGMVPAEFLGEEAGTEGLNLAFERWNLVETQLDLQGSTLGGEIFRWLNNLGRQEHAEDATLPVTYSEDSGKPFPIPMYRSEVDDCRWSRSVLRRLHGDDIVGNLLPQLNAAYLEDQGHYVPGQTNGTGYRWNAGVAMTAWTRLLLDYWRGVFPMQELLRTCPLLAPFTNGPLVEQVRQAHLQGSYLELMVREPLSFEGCEWKSEKDSALLSYIQKRIEAPLRVLANKTEVDGLDLLTRQDLERFISRLGIDRDESTRHISREDGTRLLDILRTQAEAADRYAAAVHLFHQIPRAHRRRSFGG